VPAPANTAAAAGPVEPAEPAEKLSLAAAEKLDEIKDLLITAEAIGEVNLDRHFDRVSQRQRELIREFFDKAMPGSEPGA
jgi:Tat protein secretion system quality control protein TatD with DNase activity